MEFSVLGTDSGLEGLDIFCITGSVGFFILGTTLGLEDLGIFCTEGSADFSNLGTNAESRDYSHNYYNFQRVSGILLFGYECRATHTTSQK